MRPGDFFDFTSGLAHYQGDRQEAARLNRRHAFLVAPFAEELAGARVLDLGAHDGRWAYAYAAAGAAEVLGIEARADLIARFADYPQTPFKARVTLREGDLFAALEAEGRQGASWDVVAVLGIYYHIMDHFRLLLLIRALSPRLVILDSEFLTRTEPVIALVRERTDNPLNAAPQMPGQEVAIKGVPSRPAMAAMAAAAGFRCDWADWTRLPAGQRQGVGDYFRTGRQRRATCYLRPL